MRTLIIAILLLSTQAQARTAFDTLRDAFQQAQTPATLHDFDQGKWQNCVFSDITTPMTTQQTQVRTLQFQDNSPGKGPLFPNNDYRIDVFSDYSVDRNLLSFFQNSSLQETHTIFKQSLDGPPWRRMNIYGRTDRDMLLFYVELSNYYGPQAPMYPQVYGYCWNNTSNGGDQGELPLPPLPH